MLIKPFEQSYQDEVIQLALHCQNDGTRPYIDVNNQPNLLNIPKEYFGSGGYFWIVEDKNKVVGTIGLIKCGDSIGILKKFFVNENYRGKPNNLGQKLFAKLLEYAKLNNLKTIVLDTPKNTSRAHKFYKKAGFYQITKSDLPVKYNPPYEESDYFILHL